jgi:hypothetical protein
MTTAAGNAWSIEPGSDSAIAAAAASRPAGVAWAALFVAVAVALAALTARRWLAVLALPALVVAVCLLLTPGPNGAAFFSGLSASVVAVAAALFLEAHRRLRERAAARPVPD